MKKNYENYYLGLDIGTESIGWAITDTSYNVLRVNNKPAMGVRLFNTADTAAERRSFRAARRRIERRKERIRLLQELFAEAINNKDALFFARLEDSNLYKGDKRENTKFSLFCDKGFTDKDFHKKYPTIYHLRRAMLSAVDPDPREVYLAVHHIIKYRGHFLIEGEDVSAIDDIIQPIKEINNCIEMLNDRDPQAEEFETFDLNFIEANVEKLKDLLMEPGIQKEKIRKYNEFFGISKAKSKALDKDKIRRLVVELISGAKVDIKKQFTWRDDIDDELKCDFKDSQRESNEDELRQKLDDDYVIIEQAGLLYDYAKYKSLVGDYEYLSDAMTAKYDKHRKDLALLKKVIRRDFDKATYDNVFGSSKDANYTAYVNKTKFGKKTFEIKQKDKKDKKDKKDRKDVDVSFFSFIKKLLSTIEEENMKDDVRKILEEIEQNTFLPKQVGKANSLLPYQLNLKELKQILDNAQKYPQFAFLKERDSDGISVAEKVVSLLTFRMPYYVGPVNNHSEKYWAKRIEEGPVYPWNLEKKIDLVESEDAFIQRMTNQCPYFRNEKVLPKCSLQYEEFALLNIINKIKINNELIDVGLKNKLSEHFKKRGLKELSRAKLIDWLVNIGLLQSCDKKSVLIGGIDEGINANRKSYHLFAEQLGLGEEMVEKHRDEIEQIILWATIAGPEKSNLKKRIAKNIDFLSEQQIKKIAGFDFKGWGRFSSKFLTERFGTDNETGETDLSILEVLRNTNYNLSELLGNRFTFTDFIEKQRKEESFVSYKDIDELYCSPRVKKQIWQAICVIKELKKVMGCNPEKVFIEMARGGDTQKSKGNKKGSNASRQKKLKAANKNNRSISRKTELETAYDKLKEESKEYYKEHKDEIEDVRSRLKAEDIQTLQGKNMYLYYAQLGKDIYTRKPIKLDKLTDYDKDHIYPRSKIKDDSIRNNLVLTLKTINNKDKGSVYPVAEDVRKDMEPFWRVLYLSGFMSAEKYNRLMRRTPLTAEECGDFINRQLVETRQSTKEVAALVKRIFPGTVVVYSKASNVADFRSLKKQEEKEPQFVKVRETNDLHHAKDAYLNIVVGNAWNSQFGFDAKKWLKDHGVDSYNLVELYEKNIKLGNGFAWVAGKDGTIKQVEKVMRSSAVLFSREAYAKKGELFEATIKKKGNPNLVPLKSGKDDRLSKMNDATKYGGYNSEARSYFMLVKNTVNGETKYTLLGVKLKDAPNLVDKHSRKEYCLANGLKNPEVLLDKIKIDTLFRINGTLLSLGGMTGKQIIWKPAVQCIYDEEDERYIKKILAVTKKAKAFKTKDKQYEVGEYDKITADQNLALYKKLIGVLLQDKYKGVTGFSNVAKLLKKREEDFKKLCQSKQLTQQCLVLEQILCTLKCNSETSNLSLLDEGKSCGILKMSNTFGPEYDIEIIYRSVTGIFEKKITLNELAGSNNNG